MASLGHGSGSAILVVTRLIACKRHTHTDCGEDAVLLSVHSAGVLHGMVVIAGAMQDAVDDVQQKFLAKGMTSFRCLLCCDINAYRDVSINQPRRRAAGERQNIGCAVDPAVPVVQLSHRRCVDHADGNPPNAVRQRVDRFAQTRHEPLMIDRRQGVGADQGEIDRRCIR